MERRPAAGSLFVDEFDVTAGDRCVDVAVLCPPLSGGRDIGWFFDSRRAKDKVFAVKTAEDLRRVVQATGIKTTAQYKEAYRSRNWPANPSRRFGRPLSWFFGTVPARDRDLSVGTAEELRAACKAHGVTTIEQYRAAYKRLGWPGNPHNRFGKNWSWFLDSPNRPGKTFSVSSAEELRAACAKHGIRSRSQYDAVRKKLNWPSTPHLRFGQPLSWFVGSVPSKEKVFSVKTAKDLREACRRRSIRTRAQYSAAHRRLNWPALPHKTFGKPFRWFLAR